jgi:hypothetical protein
VASLAVEGMRVEVTAKALPDNPNLAEAAARSDLSGSIRQHSFYID